MKRILFIGFILLWSFATHAQTAATVQGKVDAKNISVGDRIHYFLEASIQKNKGNLIWPSLSDTFNNLEIIEKGKIDTSAVGDLITYKQQLQISGFDSGLFLIPSFKFQIQPLGQASYELKTDSFYINIKTLSVDTTKPYKNIKDIIAVDTTWRDYLSWILGILIGLLLGILLVWYLLKRKGKKLKDLFDRKKETIDERALRELNALGKEKLWQHNQSKEHFSRLTTIIRIYVEERFGLPMLEQTTDEFIQTAKHHAAIQPYFNTLVDLLQIADMAKFAKAQPLPEEHIQSLDIAQSFIVNSTPKDTQVKN
jgi:hypothetical protein